jgi:hypothetical protein
MDKFSDICYDLTYLFDLLAYYDSESVLWRMVLPEGILTSMSNCLSIHQPILSLAVVILSLAELITTQPRMWLTSSVLLHSHVPFLKEICTQLGYNWDHVEIMALLFLPGYMFYVGLYYSGMPLILFGSWVVWIRINNPSGAYAFANRIDVLQQILMNEIILRFLYLSIFIKYLLTIGLIRTTETLLV